MQHSLGFDFIFLRYCLQLSCIDNKIYKFQNYLLFNQN